MAIPLTKQDCKYWSRYAGYYRGRDKVLGWFLHDPSDPDMEFSYQMGESGFLLWVKKATFKRRQKLGHPAPRKKPVRGKMRNINLFSLDEIEAAEKLMEKLDA